jgi:putative endonuclease
MPNKVELGFHGQKLAEDYLLAHGCTILARNFRCPAGEIDLIIRDGSYIAFVEVKYRRSLGHGAPREAVNYYKQRHIKRSALYYIMKENLSDVDLRFDVAEVMEPKGHPPEVTYLKNAFC